MTKINLVFGFLITFFLLGYFFSISSSPSSSFDRQGFEQTKTKGGGSESNIKKEKASNRFTVPVFKKLEKGEDYQSEPLKEEHQGELSKEEVTEVATFPAKKDFLNMADYLKDMAFLYEENSSDSVETVELKRKLNLKLSLNFEKIYAYDLINHIKTELNLEGVVLFGEGVEEKIKNRDMFRRFAPTAKPQSPGKLIESILRPMKLSYYFKNGKLFIVETNIEDPVYRGADHRGFSPIRPK